ncbi:putative bifunctional diguanylate cyclase/phosphodiesterase [Roseibium sp.]|uniref:putative bifunctional diguanylate cyclase/phosphodiesterase n=1 Tax=Roseibium sp. TaxID=1936156 RepID=UPI00391C651F
MLTVLSCIAFDHDPFSLGLAVAILVVGAVLTMRLYARVRRTQGSLKYMWLFLSGMIAGGTIWSTHFVSMLAYESPLILGYDVTLTAASLVIAILGTTFGLWLGSLTQRSALIEVGGAVFGLSIAAMHFTGIHAMRVSGVSQLDTLFVVVSVVLAAVFGMISTSRIARPVTRYCKYGAALAFILAVCSMHFTAMAGMNILPLRLDAEGLDLVSNQLVGMGVAFTMSVLLLSAMITYSIDTANAEVTNNQITQIAHQDPLTGLPNRKGVELFTDGLISRVALDNARVVVVTCNLSRFKAVNEALGHTTGDALLRHIARNLSTHLEQDEYVARVAGDEFVIVGKPVYYRGYLLDLCKRIQKIVAMPFGAGDDAVHVDSAVGYALFPEHAQNAEELFSAAERAMHRARSEGGNAAQCYDPAKDDKVKDQSALAIDLRKALRNNEFVLHYQLQNDVQTHDVTGTEVLLRWNHPVRGLVPPFAFIPIAEETGQILEIGAWVVRTACKEAAGWSKPIRIAVNVAPIQLSDANFPDVVANALKESGLDPSRLELEITETGIIEDTNHALQVIQQLKRLGVRIAMDDFGTGYSSLATLQAFPFDKIKIDREFIKDLGTNAQSEAIVRATIILSESLNIPVLAEGAETEEHLRLLKRHGCKEVQGFYFGKPMPASEVRHRINSGAKQPQEASETETKSAMSKPAVKPALQLLPARVA